MTVLLLGQLLLRIHVFTGSYFGEDDFLYQSRAHARGLSSNLLLANYNGQLLPGCFALAWLAEHFAPLTWSFAVMQILVLQLLAGLAFWHLLTTVFRPRVVLLVPLALYLISPLTLPAYAWWAASLSALPMQICFCMAMSSHVRNLQQPRWWRAFLTAGWVLLALCFLSRGVLIPLALFGLSLALPGIREKHRLRAVLRRHWLTWILQAVVLGGYAWAYTAAHHDAASQSARPPHSAVDVLQLIQNAATQVVAPGLLGGPWSWTGLGSPSALAHPPFLLAWLSGLAVCAFILGSTLMRRRGATMWATALVYLFGDLVLVAIGRPNLLEGVLGLEAHYVVDAIPLLYLACTFVFLPAKGEGPIVVHHLRGQLRLPSARARGAAVVAGSLALATSAAYSQHAFSVDRISRDPGRAYVQAASRALKQAPEGARVWDMQVPQTIMNGLFNDAALESAVFAPVLPRRRDQQLFAPFPEQPLLLDDSGHLVKMDLAGTSTLPGPIQGCGYLIKGGPQVLPVAESLFDYGWTLRIGYLASADTVAHLSGGPADDVSAAVPLRKGLHQVYFPMRLKGARIGIALEDPAASVCVDRIVVGRPVPAK